MKLLKVNGVAKFSAPKAGALIINQDTALRLLLTLESTTEHAPELRNALPTIIADWLHHPKECPEPLDQSFAVKWLDTLRYHCIEASRNPASAPKKATKTPKPVYIDFAPEPDSPNSAATGALRIGHETALKLLLTLESSTTFDAHIREELPAIISHWLQNTTEPPILLDDSYGQKWMDLLRFHTQQQRHKKPTALIKTTKTPKSVEIDYSGIPFPPQTKPKFTFIDLFAGIGGFRIAMEEQGGKCVFSSEWEPKAKETYYNNYGEVPFGDITKFTKSNEVGIVTPDRIPNHDMICGGFPCQPFSQAGKQLGFEDARGTLFFDILTIAHTQQPKVLFLENVKRLKGHDKGKTFKVICNALREIGYTVYEKVVRAYDQGVPQNRERIFIVAFKDPIEFEFPKDNRHSVYKKLGDIFEKKPDEKYTISDRMWDGHQRRKEGHKTKGNGFGYSIFKAEDEYANTISARYWKDGSEILIEQKDKNPRVLTPRECARLQGYPEGFQPHESKRHAYQQFGNSVAVPVIKAIGTQIQKSLTNPSPAIKIQPV
ncbi:MULTISPECIES: DNA cytosine methyltransferase [unclassified Lentimonas]|uniref:DNA cytosine methyltransferase n=1 Tax=unclassified Lentimonas TaxID=2630993 RepID=UPI001FD385C5|nr:MULTISPECIES: DNA cytosine methyltransferase [unclassified Lentimonas]